MKCYCGQESVGSYTWCEKCLKRNSENVNDLLTTCMKQHRGGAGGARICICGAGSGGSGACNGLYLLQSALENGGRMREDVLRLFGWWDKTK